MEEVDLGGPAFPQTEASWYRPPEDKLPVPSGMSLRDWFAGQALSGSRHSKWERADDGETAEAVAKWCYRLADAVLAERRKATE